MENKTPKIEDKQKEREEAIELGRQRLKAWKALQSMKLKKKLDSMR